MATPNSALVDLLRATADRLAAGASYTWGHAGQCNCGHLAQTVTGLSGGEIHRRMLEQAKVRELSRGEWSEHAETYCGGSGMDVEFIFEALLEVGLESKDLGHLEYLNDPLVLKALPGGPRELKRNNREDAVDYFRAWAGVLDRQISPASAESESTQTAAEKPLVLA